MRRTSRRAAQTQCPLLAVQSTREQSLSSEVRGAMLLCLADLVARSFRLLVSTPCLLRSALHGPAHNCFLLSESTGAKSIQYLDCLKIILDPVSIRVVWVPVAQRERLPGHQIKHSATGASLTL